MSIAFQNENLVKSKIARLSAERFLAVRLAMSAAILFLLVAVMILAGEYWLAAHVGLIGVVGPAPAAVRPKWRTPGENRQVDMD